MSLFFDVYRAEDGPTCITIEPLDEDTRKSRFTWLLNMDVKVKSRVNLFFILVNDNRKSICRLQCVHFSICLCNK